MVIPSPPFVAHVRTKRLWQGRYEGCHRKQGFKGFEPMNLIKCYQQLNHSVHVRQRRSWENHIPANLGVSIACLGHPLAQTRNVKTATLFFSVCMLPHKAFRELSIETFQAQGQYIPMRCNPAAMVPPLAIRSSMRSTRCPALTAPTCISISSLPYSNEYFSPIVLPGSFPGFRRGTNAVCNSKATGAPKMNPLASKPALSTSHGTP
jgi:hypothetical protein